MGIKIEKDQVTKSIKSFTDSYPDFADALKKANSKMGDLSVYWRGKRYLAVMKEWNDNIPMQNKALDDLYWESETLIRIFYEYTKADEDPIKLQSPDKVKLTEYKPNDNTNELTVDEKGRLLTDLKNISAKINLALHKANTMKSSSHNANWSDAGGSVDKAKKIIDTSLTNISKFLNDLRVLFEGELKSADEAYTSARNTLQS